MRHLGRGGSISAWIVRVLVPAVFGPALVPGPAAAQTPAVVIDVYNFDFGNFNNGDPFPVDPTIVAGQTVRWNWVEGFHSTTSVGGQAESWDSEEHAPSFIFDKTFTVPGTYDYFCTFHGVGMSGQVIVQPVPEPSLGLLAAGLAGGAVYGYRRRARGPSGPRRSAVTLIELLVAVAVVAVLLGLLLPAVQRVRESAGRVACRNHLRQICLATHNYEVGHGHFPGLGIEPHQDSVLARLLPYLELDGLHRQIDPDQPVFIPRADYGRLHPAQAEAARAVVPRFLCPSDGRSAVFTAYDIATLAGGSYVVNAGTGTGTYYDFRHPTDGIAWYGGRIRPRDVTDGLSSTMFASEALLGTGADSYTAATADPRRQWMSVGCMAAPAATHPGTTPPLTDALCDSPAGMTWRGDRGASWIGGPGHRTVFNTYLMPNDRMADCGSYGLGRFKASSAHPGGVHMVQCDGSVHFVKDHIDPETWRALSTRGDREPLGSYCGCK